MAKKDLLAITDEDYYLRDSKFNFAELNKDSEENKEKTLKVLGSRLKFYINEHYSKHEDDYPYGLSIKRFGELAGFNDSYLNKILDPDNNSKPTPSMNTVFRLSYFLNVNPKELIDGLELIINLPGYKIDKKNLGSDIAEYNYYHKLTDAYTQFCKDPKNNSGNEDEFKNKIKLVPVDFLITTEDSSMDAYGIKKGSSILYKTKYNEVKLADYQDFINSEHFINGKVYVVDFDGTQLIRKLWKVSKHDICILIPCSTLPEEYKIIEANCKDIKIIGIPINATISLNNEV